MPNSEGSGNNPGHPKIRFNDPPRILGGAGGPGGGQGGHHAAPGPRGGFSVDGLNDDEEIVVGGAAGQSAHSSEPQPVPVPPGAIRQALQQSQSHSEPSAAEPPVTSFAASNKIRAIEKPLQGSGEESWTRAPVNTGRGASHVRTFHSKLNDDSLRYLDSQINEWLDQHPEYEVKFVTTAIGEFTGKIKEPHMIAMVWV